MYNRYTDIGRKGGKLFQSQDDQIKQIPTAPIPSHSLTHSARLNSSLTWQYVFSDEPSSWKVEGEEEESAVVVVAETEFVTAKTRLAKTRRELWETCLPAAGYIGKEVIFF